MIWVLRFPPIVEENSARDDEGFDIEENDFSALPLPNNDSFLDPRGCNKA